MNNNNFSIMRYFRDHGVNAELLLFSDDGVGSLAHFSPDCDTWKKSDWEPYIKRIKVPGRIISMLGCVFPWSWYFWAMYLAKSVLFLKGAARPPCLHQLRKIFAEYSYIIGSGVSPALFESVGIHLAIFYPYSSGVEWVNDLEFKAQLNRQSALGRIGVQAARQRQIAGIQSSKLVLTGDFSFTSSTLKSIGVTPEYLKAPIVYIEKSPEIFPHKLKSILDKIKGFDLKIVSHTRHEWINRGFHTESDWEEKYSKHNNWIFIAFERWLKKSYGLRQILVVFEYGNDVEESKALCRELGIQDYVLWISAMPRVEIIEIIKSCDFGIGEFYSASSMTWGGGASEFMACGKPVIQGFNFDDGCYEMIYNQSPPPFVVANSVDQIYHAIKMLATDRKACVKIGMECKHWFDKNLGFGLARRWLDLMFKDV